VAKEDAADHARMKAQQRDILKNLLQKEQELAIKASPQVSLKTELTLTGSFDKTPGG
jgi:plasmid stability protein